VVEVRVNGDSMPVTTDSYDHFSSHEEFEDPEVCSYGSDHRQLDYHSCPYAIEIGGADDSDDHCQCCYNCTGDCCDDI